MVMIPIRGIAAILGVAPINAQTHTMDIERHSSDAQLDSVVAAVDA